MTGTPQSGFTLVELIVVLAIVGMLTVLVMPSGGWLSFGPNLKSSAIGVSSTLRAARARAVYGNQEVAVVFDTATGRYWPEGAPDTATLLPDTEVHLYTVQSALVNDATGTIRFFHDGTSTGGQVTLRRDREAYRIYTDWLTGRVSLEAL